MIWYLGSLFIVVFEMICCKMFFDSFSLLDGKNKRANVLFVVSMIIVTYLLAFLLYRWFLIKEIAMAISITLLVRKFYNISFAKGFTLSILYLGLLIATDSIAYAINTGIGQMDNLGSNLVIAFGKMLLFICILTIRRLYKKSRTTVLSDSEWIQFIVFPLFTVVAIAIMMSEFPYIEEERQANVLYAIAIGMVSMNLVLYHLINSIVVREMKLHEKKMFELQVKEQMETYRSISESYDKQKQKAHEFKNKILCIQALLKQQEYEKLEEYVEGIGEKIAQDKNAFDTNHVIVNVILNTKYEEATKKQIAFAVQINNLADIGISDEDIVVLLSNLLNNAIEACAKCKEQKAIQMKFVAEEKEIILAVNNTCENIVVYENNEIKTSKVISPEEHGIGIKNIIKVIEKYDGYYNIEHSQNHFYFSIIIPRQSKGAVKKRP